jgi:hypothetical protein
MQFRKGLHFLLPGWFSKTLARSLIEISANADYTGSAGFQPANFLTVSLAAAVCDRRKTALTERRYNSNFEIKTLSISWSFRQPAGKMPALQ